MHQFSKGRKEKREAIKTFKNAEIDIMFFSNVIWPRQPDTKQLAFSTNFVLAIHIHVFLPHGWKNCEQLSSLDYSWSERLTTQTLLRFV